MSNEHPIENLMKGTMESIRNMIDVNTVIGDPIETNDGSYIIPISKVCFGFASGGSEFSSNSPKVDKTAKENYPFGGGCGAGVTVKPVAFLVVRNDSVRMLPVEADTTYDRIVDTVPQVVDMIKEVLSKYCNNNKKSSSSKENTDLDSTDTACNLKPN